ncbi:transposase family protein, partial [Azotobacter beijerinckii]
MRWTRISGNGQDFSEPHHAAQSPALLRQARRPTARNPQQAARPAGHRHDHLCATLCGYDDWVGIEDFAHENEAWLREFLPLPNGIPSHDTLSDVIGRLERKAF